MIPRSTAIAAMAIFLSLAVHFFGLSLTSPGRLQLSDASAPAEEVTLGSTFEDFAEIPSEPVQPEAAPVPETPEETAPEPERADTPTSQALVASDNPQRVAAPDRGTVQSARPDTTGPSEPEQSQAPVPTTTEPSGGDESQVADAILTPPVGSDTVTETPEGDPDARAEAVEATPTSPVPTADAASAPQRLAALPPAPTTAPQVAPSPQPSTNPVIPQPDETSEPVIPTVPVEPAPENSEDDDVASDVTTPPELAVTSSLRPQLRDDSKSSAVRGIRGGSSELSNRRRPPSELIESPLAAYQRDGTDLFAGSSGGARSGGIGFSNSLGPGNSDVTNYAGEILMHLNRVPPVAVSSKGWARVFFEINPDGTLAWVDIIDGRGPKEIGSAAKRHVQRGVPFPRPPEGKGRKLNFIYSIE